MPLFAVPYVIPASLNANTFQKGSFYPQINGYTFSNNTSFNVDSYNVGIPGPANVLSQSGLTGIGGVGYDPVFDGTETVAYGAFNDGPNPTFPNAFAITGQPINNGNWSSLIPQTRMMPDPLFTFNQPTGPSAGLLPFHQLNTGVGVFDPPCYGIMILTPELGPPLNWQGRYWNPLSNAVEEQTAFQLDYPFTVYADNTTGYYQLPDFNTGLTVGLVDSMGLTVPRQVCVFQGQGFNAVAPPPIQNFMPIWDLQVFQDIWTDTGPNAGQYSIDVFKGGWLVTFFTNGSGPTKQPFEIAVIDPFWETYNLCRFMPQDNASGAQLTRTGHIDWQVKIDPNGVLYFNSGNASDAQHLAYSYSPVEFLYPDFVYTPGFITLPCYTPCDPIVMEMV